jgi:hypothetical protein
MAGAVIAIVFNLLHPRSDEVSAEEAVRLATEEGTWVFVHYMLAWTVGLGLLALVVIARSFTKEPSVSWSRVALPFAVAAAAVAFATIVVDGWGIKEAAEQTGTDAGIAVAYVSEALFLATIGAFFGLTPLLYGAAVLTGDEYPAWLGWAAVVAGLVGIVTGSLIFLDGFSGAAIVLFLVSSLLFTVWIGIMGWQLWQKAAAPAPAARATL